MVANGNWSREDGNFEIGGAGATLCFAGSGRRVMLCKTGDSIMAGRYDLQNGGKMLDPLWTVVCDIKTSLWLHRKRKQLFYKLRLA